MKLKGKLLLIGGGENKGEQDIEEFKTTGVLERLLKEATQGRQSRIEIVATASSVPREMEQAYLEAFEKLGATDVGLLGLTKRTQASAQLFLDRLDAADVLFFTGGDQLRLTSILGGTPFFDALKERLEHDASFMYAGTSAGAAAASDCMVCEGDSRNALKKGEIKTAAGFGFVENIVFDTHFIKRGRIGRLLQIVASNPMVLGVGLEENTALLVQGVTMEAVGPGSAIIADGRMIASTNLAEIADGEPISIEKVLLHAMSRGDAYNLEAHKLEILFECQQARRARS